MTLHLPHLSQSLPFCLTLSVSWGEGRSRLNDFVWACVCVCGRCVCKP